MKKTKNLNDYVVIAKNDLILYIIIFFISLIGLLIYAYKENWYGILFFLFLPIFGVIGKISVYRNILKLVKYIKNNHLYDSMGEICFWNDSHYMLTDNYVFFVYPREVIYFQYSDIKEIYKTMKWHLGRPTYWQEYLHIKLKNGNEYEVLTWSTSLVEEEYKDISKFLLEKNSSIIYDEKSLR